LALVVLWMLRLKAPERLWAAYPGAALFLVTLAVYLSTFRWHGGDDLPNILLPFALLRHGTFCLDYFQREYFMGDSSWYLVTCGNQHISLYPPATGLMALPLYLIPWLFRTPLNAVGLHSLSKISASLMTAASVAILWQAIRSKCSHEWGLCLCLLYGLGTWSLSVSSQALWQHAPAQLAIALGLWGLSRAGFRWDLLAGLGFALAVAVRPDQIFFAAAAFSFITLHHRDKAAGFACAAAFPAALVAAYWLHFSGRLTPPESTVQMAMFGGFSANTLLALVLSPTRGLVFCFPASAFGAWAGMRRGRDPLARWMLAACAAQLLMFSFYAGWAGGNTFGSRYLSSMALILTWLCADAGFEKRLRSGAVLLRLWAWSFSLSILVHALGGYLAWPGPPSLIEQKATAWHWELHPLPNMLTPVGSLARLPAAARFAIMGLAIVACAKAAKALVRRLSPAA
jgi:hypothetical protein